MDWYVIEYLYPIAFQRFKDTMFPNVGIISLSTLGLYDSKKLYQFFDKEGVYLTVEMYNPHQWVFTISLKNGIVFGPTQESKTTREETETDGFIECFRILDKKFQMTNKLINMAVTFVDESILQNTLEIPFHSF